MSYKRVDLKPHPVATPRVPYGKHFALGWGVEAGTVWFAWWNAEGKVVHETSEPLRDGLAPSSGTEADDGSVVVTFTDSTGETRSVRRFVGVESEDVTSWTLGQGFDGVASHFGLWRGSKNGEAAVLDASTKQVRILPKPPGAQARACSAVLGPSEFVVTGPASSPQSQRSYVVSGTGVTAIGDLFVTGRADGWLVGIQAYEPFDGFRYSFAPAVVPVTVQIPPPPQASRVRAHYADRYGNVTGYAWGGEHSFRPFLYDGDTNRWLDDVVPGTYAWPAPLGLEGHVLTREGATDVLLVPKGIKFGFFSEPLTIPIEYGTDANGMPTMQRVIGIRRPDGRVIWIPYPKPPRPFVPGLPELEQIVVGTVTELGDEDLAASEAFLRNSLKELERLARSAKKKQER